MTDDRSEAARAMGRAKSPAKTEAARANAKQPRGPMSQETKDKISQSRRRRQGESETAQTQ